MTTIVQWLQLSRWREWAQSKLLYFAGAALLLAPAGIEPSRLLAMIATFVPWAAFGYGINDMADLSADTLARKRNRAAPLSRRSRALYLILTAAGALGLSVMWAADLAGPVCVFAGLLLATAYSVRPVRLKERGFLGLAAPAAAQWALPVLAISAGERNGWQNPAAWSLSLVGLAIGVRWMGVHQLQDERADRAAGLRTYAVDGGPVRSLIVTAFASEITFLCLGLLWTWPRSMPALIALGCWILVAGLPRLRQGSFEARLQSYDEAPLAEYYFLMLPVSLALGVSAPPPAALALTVLFALLGWGYVKRMAFH